MSWFLKCITKKSMDTFQADFVTEEAALDKMTELRCNDQVIGMFLYKDGEIYIHGMKLQVEELNRSIN
jgi:hypothetical protein